MSDDAPSKPEREVFQCTWCKEYRGMTPLARRAIERGEEAFCKACLAQGLDRLYHWKREKGLLPRPNAVRGKWRDIDWDRRRKNMNLSGDAVNAVTFGGNNGGNKR